MLAVNALVQFRRVRAPLRDDLVAPGSDARMLPAALVALVAAPAGVALATLLSLEAARVPYPATIACAAGMAVFVAGGQALTRYNTAFLVRRSGGRDDHARVRRADPRATRLSLVAFLAATGWADFAVLRDSVGLSDSALSKQLATLEGAGSVEIRKAFAASGRAPRPGSPRRPDRLRPARARAPGDRRRHAGPVAPPSRPPGQPQRSVRRRVSP